MSLPNILVISDKDMGDFSLRATSRLPAAHFVSAEGFSAKPAENLTDKNLIVVNAEKMALRKNAGFFDALQRLANSAHIPVVAVTKDYDLTAGMGPNGILAALREISFPHTGKDDNPDGHAITHMLKGKRVLQSGRNIKPIPPQYAKILELLASHNVEGNHRVLRMAMGRGQEQIGRDDINTLKVQICMVNRVIEELADQKPILPMWGIGYRLSGNFSLTIGD